MTNRYVDTVIGASANYDPVSRAASGGSGTPSYATMQAAHDAASSGDTIYLRSGGETLTGTITSSKSIKWRAYADEVYRITTSYAGTNGVMLFSTAAGDADFGLGQLVVNHSAPSTLTNTHPVVRNQITGTKCHGIRVETWGTKTSTQGGCFITLVAASSVMYADRWILKDCLNERGINSGATGTLHAASWVFRGRSTLGSSNGSFTAHIYNPTYLGAYSKAASKGLAEVYAGNSIKIYNPIMVGNNFADVNLGMQIFRQASTGTLDIYGGIVHKHVHSYAAAQYNYGSIASNTSDAAGIVRFRNNDNPFYVAICLQDSRFADGTGVLHGDGVTLVKLSDYKTMMEAYPQAKLCYFPDDHQYWNANHDGEVSAWVVAGHELNSWSISGADDWGCTRPFTLTYSGAETNVQLIIEDNGETWSVVADSGTLAGPYDCSLTGAYHDLGVYNAVDPESPPENVSTLKAIKDTVAGLTVTVGPDNLSVSGTFDDARAAMMEDGVYPIPASGTTCSPLINRQRRMDFEIARSKEITEQRTGLTPKVLYCNGTGTNTDVGVYCATNGWIGVLDNGGADRLTQTITGFNPFGIYRGLGNSACSALFGASGSTTEAQIRAGARILASWGFVVGGFFPLIFTNVQPLSATQLGYLVDELLSLGVNIVTFEQAIAAKQSASVAELSDYGLAADSAGVGAAAKWWTGANPVGADGEPFSDFDTDCGAIQSTTGPFHPVNL